jgi:hypothetical protein
MKRTTTAAAFILCAALALAVAGCASPRPAEPSPKVQAAKALFDEHCKKAGVFIHRTVKDVDGILVMKLRPTRINYGNQYELDDPYGSDFRGDAYLESFLRGNFLHDNGGRPMPAGGPPRSGYRYVEAISPADGQRYRYTGRVEEPWQTNKAYLKGYTRYVMEKAPAPGPAPRYGVTYDDISTREDRDHWVAGSSLRVVDTHSGEVLAERIGYLWDPGQGGNSGGRSAWLHAASYACPPFIKPPSPQGMAFRHMTYQTLDLVEAVLIPTP